MSKDPAFLFYYQDFMWGTRFWTPYERGIYIELMCEQADSKTGSIPEEHMKNICKTYEKDSYNTVISKFKKDENGYYNSVLREHLIKRRKYSESRSENRKGKKKKKNISKTYDNHMENVNENVISLFNSITGKNIKITDSRKKTITARIKEGHTLDDFKQVISTMYHKWKDDDKMKQYITPDTLFRASHFQKYLEMEQVIKHRNNFGFDGN